MSEEIPPVLYKYLAVHHAESMVRTGTVRVGSLYGYRAMEGTDAERGDEAEGKLEIHSPAGAHFFRDSSSVSPSLRPRIHISNSTFIGENAFVLRDSTPDILVYCLSTRFDESALVRWGGACVRIENSVRFFRALDDSLISEIAKIARVAQPPNAGRCIYAERRRSWDNVPADYWLVKPPKFRHQNEVRIAWIVADSKPLSPLLVASRAIAECCSIHATAGE